MKILFASITLGIVGVGSYLYLQSSPSTPVNESAESVVKSVESKESAPTSASSMPANWPNDVPVAYTGATILSTQTVSAVSGKKNPTVNYNVSARRQEVIDYYMSGLESKGWKLGAPFEAQGYFTITATKDTRSVALYIGEQSGIVSVTAGVALE